MIKINFLEQEIEIVRQALGEIGGYAGKFMPEFLGVEAERIEQLDRLFDEAIESKKLTIELPLEQWRLVYDSVNFVIYELGPEELRTITGYRLHEFLDVGQIIYAKAYGRTPSRKWGQND